MAALSDEMKALTALFEGTWRGPETLFPSPWEPTGGPAFGTWRVWLDGLYLLVDYAEERGGEVVYRGHGVNGWDAKDGVYLEYWFDNQGAPPRAPNLATLVGGVYRYVSASANGTSRFTYTFEGDTLHFTIELGEPDGAWTPLHDGRYTRVYRATGPA